MVSSHDISSIIIWERVSWANCKSKWLQCFMIFDEEANSDYEINTGKFLMFNCFVVVWLLRQFVHWRSRKKTKCLKLQNITISPTSSVLFRYFTCVVTLYSSVELKKTFLYNLTMRISNYSNNWILAMFCDEFMLLSDSAFSDCDSHTEIHHPLTLCNAHYDLQWQAWL